MGCRTATGRDHFDRLDRDRLIRYHTRRLAERHIPIALQPDRRESLGGFLLPSTNSLGI
jgi:hypothetical protein